MPYKNQEERRDKAAERQRKHRRGVTEKGVTSPETEGVTQQGVTVVKGTKEAGMAQGMTEYTKGVMKALDKGTFKVLSDGQLWYPGNKGYHPSTCNCGIEHKERM